MQQHNILSCIIIFLLILFSQQYNPISCTVNNYYFTFIKDDTIYKVHGLWPESCKECISCGYPSCCMNNVTYTYPQDPTNFIKNNWFYSITHNECNGVRDIILFEHEFYKHGTCMNIHNTTQYLDIIINLYNKYYEKYVVANCIDHHQLWLYLDSNHNYVKTLCV